MSDFVPVTADDEPQSQESQQPSQATTFEADTVEACEAIVEEYRTGRTTKSTASRDILNVLGAAGAGDPEQVLSAEQKDQAYDDFFEQLEEIDRIRSSNVSQGRLVSGPTIARDFINRGNTATGGHPPQFEDTGNDVDLESNSVRATNSVPSLLSRIGPKRFRFDEDDEDDERTERKGKRRIDESLFPFLPQPEDIDSFTHIDERIGQTLTLKENYSRDWESVKRSVLSQYDCPDFPQECWKQVILHEFVDFDKILSSHYSIETTDTQVKTLADGLEIHARAVKTNRSVSNHGEWVTAWDGYTHAVQYLYPHRIDELTKYARHISETFASIQPALVSRVINYDKAIRSRVARRNDTLLTDFFGDLYTLHISSEGAASSPTAQRPQTTRGRTTEICRRFNQGICDAPGNCRYRHSCAICRGNTHAAIDCPRHSSPGTEREPRPRK